MIRRIVKMTFRKEETEAFRSIFQSSAPHIRSMPGCRHLELWQDQDDERVFFTFSYWESKQDLENYRMSALFTSTWEKTKALFDDRPQAWSVDQLEEHP